MYACLKEETCFAKVLYIRNVQRDCELSRRGHDQVIGTATNVQLYVTVHTCKYDLRFPILIALTPKNGLLTAEKNMGGGEWTWFKAVITYVCKQM